MFFQCKHPFDMLVVLKPETTENVDADFDVVTYHFQCAKCDEILTKKYTRLVGGVEAFLKRETGDSPLARAVKEARGGEAPTKFRGYA